MQETPRPTNGSVSPASSRMKAELEMRAEVKRVEAEMTGIVGRVRKIDDVLSKGLSPQTPRGSSAAITQYLAWLDSVEALGLSFVNANIVTQGLRLFYQGARKTRRGTPDPEPRMKEVKDLLETVRHTEQSELVLLRAKRATLLTGIHQLAEERKTELLQAATGGKKGRGVSAVGWFPAAVLLVAVLLGVILIEAFRPEIAAFVRGLFGLRAAP